MSTHLSAKFDHTDRADLALRLLRDNGIEPESFQVRSADGDREGHITGYGTAMPDAFAYMPFAPMGVTGSLNVGWNGVFGSEAGFVPATIGLHEHSPGGTVDMAGDGEVELQLVVANEQSAAARALLRSAHGQWIH